MRKKSEKNEEMKKRRGKRAICKVELSAVNKFFWVWVLKGDGERRSKKGRERKGAERSCIEEKKLFYVTFLFFFFFLLFASSSSNLVG